MYLFMNLKNYARLLRILKMSVLVDWQMLTLKLRRVKPLCHIANEVGSDWQHLNRLARGDVAEPRWSTGVKLLDYYHDHVGDMEAIRK